MKMNQAFKYWSRENKHLWARKTRIKYRIISQVTSGWVMCWTAILGLLQHFSCCGGLSSASQQSRRLASHDAVWSDCWETRITVLLSFQRRNLKLVWPRLITWRRDQLIARVWHVIWCQCNGSYNGLISVSVRRRSRGQTLFHFFFILFWAWLFKDLGNVDILN